MELPSIIPEVVPSVVPSEIPLSNPIKKSKTLGDHIEYGVEYFMRKVIFWETDEIRIGKLIRFIHHTFLYCVILLYFYTHIISTSYFSFLILFFTYGIVWVHHMICRCCIYTKIEQRLIGDNTNFLDPLMDIFNIPKTGDIPNGILLLFSCFLMCTLTCELISRTLRSLIQIFSY